VFSVLKDAFSEKEKDLLCGFVEWSRRSGPPSTRRRPVILMTGVELFAQFNIESAWKAKGVPYEPHAAFHTFLTLETFAEATQEIHLGTIPYYDWLAQERSRAKN
ncbi:MAG: hypothetical protein Q8L63_01215, partial [Alphaproteobacteria bacterium]|nr:hypothetical protein [Alphaproteobacteria bacterium]